MTKEQKKQIDDLYNMTNKLTNDMTTNIINKDKEEKKKAKERQKRIKQRKRTEKDNKDKFDFDTETVIGITNKNNRNNNKNSNKNKTTQPKKMTKKQAKIERKKKKIKKILKLIILIALIAGGTCFALISPIFNIEKIEVTGNNKIPSETIISLSQLENGQNIFRFNKNKTVEEIKTNAYIENAKISRKIPNKIEINIEEREATYNVEFLNGYAYINNQGYILEKTEQKIEKPVIRGISTEQEQIVEGNRLNDDDLEKLETVIQIMNICKSYELDTKVSSIDVTSKNDYILEMDEEKKTVHLGNDSNLNNKMLYVPAILTENKGKEGTIYLNGDINNNFKPRFREKV